MLNQSFEGQDTRDGGGGGQHAQKEPERAKSDPPHNGASEVGRGAGELVVGPC